MKFKPLIALAACAAVFAPRAAADEALCLRVGLADGSESFYEVAEGLEWRLAGGKLSVTPVKESPCSFEVDDVAVLSYGLHTFNAIGAPEGTAPVVRLTADGFAIEGAPDDSRCIVADMTGRVVADHRFDGSTVIRLLPPGTYVATINYRESFKVTVR